MNFDSLLSDFSAKRWKTQPFERLIEFLKTSPSQTGEFAEAVLLEVPQGGTFLDLSLSFVSQREFEDLVSVALRILSTSGSQRAAEAIIAYASLQFPPILHRHLSQIFTLAQNRKAYYANWPWRESGGQSHDELVTTIKSDASDELRLKAWRCLLETRFGPAMNDAFALATAVPTRHPLSSYFLEVGFELPNKQLYSGTPHHIIFSPGYFTGKRPAWSSRSVHPTWHLAGEHETCRFGGCLTEICNLCGGQLHHLITLPAGLVPADTLITLATCLSCLGYERQRLFYSHDVSGTPRSIDSGKVSPQFPAVALRETTVRLVTTPQRWNWQDWGLSNNRENLSRVGGYPSWIQSAEYPPCPACGKLMQFMLQLDSDLPSEDGGEWLWGSGGICYGFWCGGCRISGFTCQCT